MELYKELIRNSEFIISKQLLKTATSIGVNVNEAQAAASKKDFLNKMSIAAKEARENDYWLKLLHKSQFVKYDYEKYLIDINALIKMLTAIVKSTKNNLILTQNNKN